MITDLEDHELVVRFWRPGIDVNAIRQCYDKELDSLVLHYK